MQNTSMSVEAKENQKGVPLTQDDVLKTVKKITVNTNAKPVAENPETVRSTSGSQSTL
jgi:hypothetical protein